MSVPTNWKQLGRMSAMLVYGIDLGDWCEGALPDIFEDKCDTDVGVELTYHCSHRHTRWLLVVKDATTVAVRGHPQEIKPDELKLPKGANEALKAVCKKFNLPWSEPKWLLACLWG